MKVIKATDRTIEALRRCSAISRDYSSNHIRKNSGFCMENSNGQYSGPFMTYWKRSDAIEIMSPDGYIDANDRYAGSICTPDMMIAYHVPQAVLEYSEEETNSLIVLKVDWTTGNSEFVLAPDPWKTWSDTDKNIVIDYLNPVTSDYPTRNPWIGLYPIARIMENGSIYQIQQGHIIDYGRWWRS